MAKLMAIQPNSQRPNRHKPTANGHKPGPEPWPFFLIARKPAGWEFPGKPGLRGAKVMLTYHTIPYLWEFSQPARQPQADG